MPPRSAEPRVQGFFRPEIQGLRAVAVGAVIVDHLTGWPGGGFLGVDVFFVISGFLITGLLLRERETTGRISFTGFYSRRVRRIIPATVLVLVVTVLASFYLLNAGRGRQTLVDGVWSLFFSANWRFALTGTDYFQAGGPRSPLEHFWSLGVEEQFYLVWPWLMVAIFALVGRRVPYASRVGHRLVGVVMALIVLVSFGYACFITITNPTWAYFSTFARVWELGVGALLATMTALLASIPAAWRPALAWLGLAGILASFWVIDSGTLFLGPWGTLPVLSTALVIAAGTGAQPRYLLPLTHPVSVWIGELSYSLYLWHFPVIILMASVLPERSVLYYVCTSVLILGLSVAAFYGLEDPVRKSSWLTGRSAEEKSRRAGPVGRFQWPRLLGAGCLVLACLMFVGVAVTREQSSDATSRSLSKGGSAADVAGRTEAESDRAAAILDALSATKWPELRPDLGDLENAVGSPPCALNYSTPPVGDAAEVERRCVLGDPEAKRAVLVLGDSLANSYLPAVTAAVESEGWKVVGLTRNGCPAIDIELLRLPSLLPYPECDEHQKQLPKLTKKLDPDLIVITSGASALRNRLASSATGDQAYREWRKAEERSLAKFAKTAPVVVLQGPPRGMHLAECTTRFSRPAECVSTPSSNHFAFDKTERKAVKAVRKAEDADVRYVKTQDWFCSADLHCPGFVGKTPTFTDGGHLTVDAARSLSPLVREALSKSMED